jgi:hypothetical protein
MSDTTEIDTTNYQLVSVNGAGTVVVLAPQRTMTREQALLHAAWLVAICAPDHNEFERVYAAVLNT